MKKGHKWLALAVLILVAFGLGYGLGGSGESSQGQHATAQGSQDGKAQVWTCSMHPTVRETAPGKCRYCGMDLIPAAADSSAEAGGATELKLSARARKLAAIQVAPVERKFVTAEIRMAGKVTYDETRLSNITAWVPGRIDRLFADYTGIPVRKGDHMVELYSPELLTTQQELLQALKTSAQTEKGGSVFSTQNVVAVRERLRLWGLTAEQIAQIEERGTPSDRITIHAPIGGIVIDMPAGEGTYVKTGTIIYTIADLSRVWVKLDAYESDLVWLRYGQEVEFEAKGYAGEMFAGKIAFIDPIVDARTRTIKVRVNVDNANGRLKPQMFVRAVVRAKLAADGAVLAPDLAGKWISPMHPEIVKDAPGSCDVCGMPLVRAETQGYAGADATQGQAPLVIPASAPLITGKRAVVYVASDPCEGIYEGREVVLGARAGDHYLVKGGLSEGELVVVNGNFKIDSALQLRAKPSMMSPAKGADADAPGEEVSPMIAVPESFQSQLTGLFESYLAVQEALSHDRFADAKAAAKAFMAVLNGVDMSGLAEQAHREWMIEKANLKQSAMQMLAAADIEKLRQGDALLSESMTVLAHGFGIGGIARIVRLRCPMAFGGRGAEWLQDKREVENPYFGAAMFRCGAVVETIDREEEERP